MLYYRPGGGAPLADIGALGLATQAEQRTVDLALPVGGAAQVRAQPVAAVPLRAALPVLVRDTRGHVSASLQTYARAARLALGLVAEQQLVPVLRATGDEVRSHWRVLLPAGGTAADTLAALADALPAAGHALPSAAGQVWHPHALLRAFVDAVADLLARRDDADGGGTVPPRPRARLLPWTARWQEAAADARDPSVPLGVERGEIVAGVGEWLRPFEQPAGDHTPELELRAPERPGGAWTLHFSLRGRDGRRIDAAALWSGDGGGDTERDRVEALLEALARAARVFAPVEDALDERQPTHASFDAEAAWRFIDQVAPLLGDAGYRVVLSERISELRPRVQLGAGGDGEAGARPDDVELTWQATVDDAVLDTAAVDALLASDDPLVFWDGRWVRITPETRTQWQLRGEVARRLPLIEALGLAVAGAVSGLAGASAERPLQVTAVGPLAGLVDRLRQASGDARVTVPAGFVGELRPYQLDAVGWLGMMAELQLGGVLADDMGLGKTIMLIVHLLRQGPGPHLVVCPTSVVANWERELARFAPDLVRHRHHGADRSGELTGLSGVVVTSYGTLRRDIDLLSMVDWQVVALDEAQQVKNPDTLGARAVRRLRSEHCVALTGTPVENRLRELWSLLDLTNPGLLGPRARFERRFANPIERRGDTAARTQLRRMIAPFVLRRTKSDPRVAPDLPPRIERTVPCALTDAQRERYRATVEAFRRRAEGPQTTMQYRGAVLALLTRLKQICDHPGLGGDGPPARAGRSGKLDVTRQLVVEATRAGEQVLVFTQFVRMAELLAHDLSSALQTDLPVLHGGMAAGARQRVVDRFQGELGDAPPVLIASLRAGGVGMNLTAATQVIHYDRWWNPAVEDQASDRAHRIGQTERVLIHRLVTMGTLEERIDALLADKREIAEAVVGAGETWITELDAEQLLELVALDDAEAEHLVAGGRR